MPARTIEEIREDLDRQHREVGELYKKLDKSLRIQTLWPDAFADGQTCTPILIGFDFPRPAPAASGSRKYPDPYHNVQKVKECYLERSDGVRWNLTTEEFMSIYEPLMCSERLV